MKMVEVQNILKDKHADSCTINALLINRLIALSENSLIKGALGSLHLFQTGLEENK